MTIAKHLKKATNITYLATLRENAEKQPDADRMSWMLGTKIKTYLVPTTQQLVKQRLGGAFLQWETGLRFVISGSGGKGFRIAGFHTIDVLDGRDDSPKKGRRSLEVRACWAPLLPPDDDPYL